MPTKDKDDARSRQIIEEDFRAIEASIGVTTPNQQFRQQLAQIVRSAMAQLHGPPDVRSSAMYKAIRQYRSDAIQLLNRMVQPTNARNAHSEEAWAYEYAAMQLGMEEEGSPLELRLRKIVDDADLILDFEVSDKGGQTPNIAEVTVLIGLRGAYEGVTGRKAASTRSGPFIRFLHECTKRLLPEMHKSEEAFRSAIRRHLKL